jgi:adenine-specific DNA-methyltransferase
MKDGFCENLEYLRLDFLDPHEVAYGKQFEAIVPVLWLMAGAQGGLMIPTSSPPWLMPEGSTFAVLVRESRFAEFKRALAGRQDIRLVFLVTDSEDTKMLYKSYLSNFCINLENQR